MKTKYLNLGCGSRFVKDWVNLDFVSANEHVIGCNLLEGIPFGDNTFDVVYHSHVLEHFTKEDGIKFIKECFRVLKPGGIIRIVVPDLEMIARNYLDSMEQSLNGTAGASENYEWMMLELYDQVVRNKSGGNMAKYLQQRHIPNEEFVFSRLGEEARLIHVNYVNSISDIKPSAPSAVNSSISRYFRLSNYINKIKSVLSIGKNDKSKIYHDIGKFRLGGEVHQWMYDRYSLSLLLKKSGFIDMKRQSAFESLIDGWNEFELESKNGVIYKPDSLFFEASKPL